MTRLLIVLGLLVGLVLGADALYNRRQQAARELASTLRPLAGLAPPAIVQFELQLGDRDSSWRYVLDGDFWRYPAYHQAVVETERVERLLRDVLTTPSTVVSVDPARHAHYGLSSDQMMRLRLAGLGGDEVLVLEIGRATAGGGECYLRLAGADTVYHLHANPRTAIDWDADATPAPLLDPNVLSRALGRGAPVEVSYTGGGAAAPRRLRRVEIETPAATPTVAGPEYAWLVNTAEGGELRCNQQRVYEYLHFLAQLRYTALHDAAAWQSTHFAQRGRSLVLRDLAGAVDTLQLGDRVAGGDPLLLLRTTGQVASVTAAHAALLLPPVATLLDTAQSRSPFADAEPRP